MGDVLAILGVFLGELGLDREICGAGGLGAQNGFYLVVVGGQVVEIWGDECGLGGIRGIFGVLARFWEACRVRLKEIERYMVHAALKMRLGFVWWL